MRSCGMRTGLDGVVPSVRLVATVLQGCEGRSRSLQPTRRVLQKCAVSDVAYDAVRWSVEAATRSVTGLRKVRCDLDGVARRYRGSWGD